MIGGYVMNVFLKYMYMEKCDMVIELYIIVSVNIK